MTSTKRKRDIAKDLFLPKGLSRLDYIFFISVGVILAFIMVIYEKTWPESATPTFNNLLQDHMPIMTIEILSFTIISVTLIHLALKKSHQSVVHFLKTIVERLHQLTAPIMLLIAGMALALLLCSLPSFPARNRYFHYFLAYVVLAGYPYALIFSTNLAKLANTSSFSSDMRELVEKRLYARIFLFIFGIAVLLVGVYHVCSKDPAVSLSFTDEEYRSIKAEASMHKQSPEAYLKTVILNNTEEK